MATLDVPPVPRLRVRSPQSRRWTKAEYHKMWELGWFEDQQIELLEGEIIQAPSESPPHCVSRHLVHDLLRGIFPRDWCWVRMRSPLDLGATTEPQPDVAVADGPLSRFTRRHPTTALLVVEAGDASLGLNRGRKAGIYARAGIADYWIVNIVARQLEVHRRPVADAAPEGGYRYDEKIILGEADSVSPLAAPHAVIRVATLLP